MEKALRLVVVGLASLLVLAGCSRGSQNEAEPTTQSETISSPGKKATSKTQDFKGLHITVVGVERTAEWVEGPFIRVKPESEGHNVALVHIEVTAPNNGSEPVELEPATIEDASGNIYDGIGSVSVVPKRRPFSHAIPFSVPEQARLKSFRLGENVIFDLEE